MGQVSDTISKTFHPFISSQAFRKFDTLEQFVSRSPAAYFCRACAIPLPRHAPRARKHADPNNDSPLNTEAAQLWADQDEYRKVCKQKYQEGQAASK